MARRKKALHIKSASQLRALRTPLRQEIVQALTKLGACTVRELADELGREPAALYYHVHALREAGMAVETGRRQGTARPESVYDLVADRIVIDRGVASRDFVSALTDLQRSTLRTAERELARAVQEKDEGDPGDAAPAMLLRLSSRLKPRAAARAAKLARELAEFLAENDDEGAEDSYALTVAFVRLAK